MVNIIFTHKITQPLSATCNYGIFEFYRRRNLIAKGPIERRIYFSKFKICQALTTKYPLRGVIILAPWPHRWVVGCVHFWKAGARLLKVLGGISSTILVQFEFFFFSMYKPLISPLSWYQNSAFLKSSFIRIAILLRIYRYIVSTGLRDRKDLSIFLMSF